MPSLIQQLHFPQELPGCSGWGGFASLGLYINHFKQEVLNAVIALVTQQMLHTHTLPGF